MAVDARKSAHTLAVHLSALMALGAEFFRREEVVQTALIRFHFAVAFGTLNLLHVHMLCMEQRLIDLLSFPFLGMALVAGFRAYDDLSFMPCWNRVRPVKYKTDEELVLFGDRKVVTFMAVQ